MTRTSEAVKRLESLRKNLPSTKHEDFRFTSLKRVDFERECPQVEASEVVASEHAQFVILRSSQGSTGSPSSSAVELTKVDASAEGLPQAFRDDPIACWAVARAGGRLEITIPPHTHREEPLHLLTHFDQETAFFPYDISIRVGKGSSVKIIEENQGKGFRNGRAPVVSSLVEVHVEEGASLHYSVFQNWGYSVEAYQRHIFSADREASIRLDSAFSGGSKGQYRYELVCAGEDSSIDMNSTARGDQLQQFDFWVRSMHPVPRGTSKMNYWTVMADRARAIFNGNILITPKGTQTNAEQRNRNMILSENAVIDTLPKLEIATDDVQCAHGASVASVDPEQVYYLESRGISKNEAEEMIIEGFTNTVVDRLATESLRERVRKAFHEKRSVR